MAGMLIACAPVLHADILLQHDFGGSSSSPLQETSPGTDVFGAGSWIASAIIAANGDVTDGTNTDRGAYLDLGASFSFKKNSTYTLNLSYSGLDNAILFAGFATAAPAVESQMQTQGTNFALRIRDQATTPGKGLWITPGSLYTAGTSDSPAGTGNATLTLYTADLTDATVTVEGSVPQTVDLSEGYRYLWIGFEDPSAASPASSARFSLVQLEGPLPDPPPVSPETVTFDPPSGIVTIGQTVTLSSTTTGASIRFTTDGTEPTASSSLYSAPITISSPGEIRAKAFKDDLESISTSAFYAIVPEEKPNVILIIGESIGTGDLSSYGSVGIHTPSLDQLAWDGVRFTEASLPASGSIHGIQALLIGRTAGRTGLDSSPGPDTPGISPNEWTLAEALRKSGYATAFIGSWDLGSTGGTLPHEQGYQLFRGLPWPLSGTPSPSLLQNDDLIETSPDPSTLLADFTNSAQSFITARAGEKFFLTLRIPSLPATGGASVQGPNGNRIEDLDASVGAILSTLDQLALAEKTLVVFASASSASRATSGPSLGTNAILKDGDGSTWEGGLRVPVIARWPGVIPPHTQSIATLPLTDIFSSLADIAGAWLPGDRPIDGTSRPEILLGVRNGLTPEIIHPSSLHESGGTTTRTIRQGRWKLHFAYQNTDPGNTYSQAAPLLFDLAIDPSERINRADTQISIVNSLTTAAAAHDATLSPSVIQLPPSRPPFLGTVKTEISDGSFIFRFDRPVETIDDRYLIEISEDLVTWTPLPIGQHIVSLESSSDSSERLEIRYQPASAPASGRLFGRLRGTNP
ncbi:MAG: sulfatase-like hydrolase/transferase [Luteolibacter sp.]